MNFYKEDEDRECKTQVFEESIQKQRVTFWGARCLARTEKVQRDV